MLIGMTLSIITMLLDKFFTLIRAGPMMVTIIRIKGGNFAYKRAADQIRGIKWWISSDQRDRYERYELAFTSNSLGN
jgi:hypothetical protein